MNTVFKVVSFLTVLVIVSIPTLVMAAPGFRGTVNDGVDCPLDGGLSLLAVAGAGYCTKKIAQYRKAKKA